MAGPPLRLLVLSDLHVDYPQNLARVPKLVQSLQAQEADAFVLAGDIGHKLEQVEGVLRAFAVLDMPKLFVCGNHDVWIVREGREDVVDSWDKMRRIEDLCRRHGFVPLDAENASVGGFQFVGSMGWYDYSFARADLGISHAEYEKKNMAGSDVHGPEVRAVRHGRRRRP